MICLSVHATNTTQTDDEQLYGVRHCQQNHRRQPTLLRKQFRPLDRCQALHSITHQPLWVLLDAVCAFLKLKRLKYHGWLISKTTAVTLALTQHTPHGLALSSKLSYPSNSPQSPQQ
jgi:hypothetical protein